MAEFNPPDNHWAADFDARMWTTFHWLKDRVEALEAKVREQEARDAERDAALARAVADMKFYAKGK